MAELKFGPTTAADGRTEVRPYDRRLDCDYDGCGDDWMAWPDGLEQVLIGKRLLEERHGATESASCCALASPCPVMKTTGTRRSSRFSSACS
jgi:hypothetical protein